MQIRLETITSSAARSFSLMFNPRLSDLFFWHFHPEYELVYIENAWGNRHVGEHFSRYNESDLVLIGSNIPHLNFDYGVTTEYRKVVLHLKKEWVESHFLGTPELDRINRLFRLSSQGVAFRGALKRQVGASLFELEGLTPYEQYFRLVALLQALAESGETELLHEKPYQNPASTSDQERIRKIFAYIDANYQDPISLEAISDTCSLSREAFCRYFKKMTSYTFTEFLNRYRVSQAKRELLAGSSVSDACFASGFQSLSYFNRVFNRITGSNPSAFREAHRKGFPATRS
ncbi:AraC family transcriptional regulator [Robiginitalea sp. SC105]|uniref:AraC family transcriptional regulator n=1 Tax=Robiginitalea sp. SC105 TaxID=2762332 RepID=UPI001639CA7F|nr:AraC family transcriptional regulator [Robiginitalea sp. SC105]MBC2839313.1 helix-turn-helix transcriptional regulator [Robiginitalea sp. SC105]